MKESGLPGKRVTRTAGDRRTIARAADVEVSESTGLTE